MILKEYEICKRINVYRDLFENLEETFNFIKDTEANNNSLLGSWEDWYVFGKILRTCSLKDVTAINEKNKKEIKIYEELLNIVDTTLKNHIEKYGYEKVVDQYEWQISGPSVCKYEPTDKGPHEDPNHALTYHTDYQNEFDGQPGLKSGFTITIYFNDDFDGGDVDFYTGEEVVRYKPKAGDVVIFPSGSPDIDPDNRYLHASHIVKDKPKYFARFFAVYNKEATQEYLDGVEKYGEEEWLDMLSKKAEEIRKNFYDSNIPSDSIPRRTVSNTW